MALADNAAALSHGYLMCACVARTVCATLHGISR